MVVAPIAAGREADLRALLSSMNAAPGMADPRNPIVPFGAFERLHFARLVVLDDQLQVDLEAYGVEPPRLPTYLAFIGDCDGPADDALADLAQRAGAGLARIFSHCEGFVEEAMKKKRGAQPGLEPGTTHKVTPNGAENPKRVSCY